MTQQTHRRRVGDTRTVLPVALVQPNTSGVLTAVDLTGLTVQFKMLNAATGATEIALTSTGVTVTTAATGQVQYDFSGAGVDTAGVYWGTFVVTRDGLGVWMLRRRSKRAECLCCWGCDLRVVCQIV